MAAQLRPTRLDVTDRFPMLGFTIRTDNAPRVAEVVIATDPALFTRKEGRSHSTFYSSREHGLLSVPRNEAVYVLPPEVLARFVAADRLWFGLATASPPTASDWIVDQLPTAQSPYISLAGLSDRSMRRVRMFPSRREANGYGGGRGGPILEWAADKAAPGMQPANSPSQPAPAPANGAAPATPAPTEVAYDDGFGPLPPLAPQAPPPATPTAQSHFGGATRTFEADPDDRGIDGPVLDEEAGPQAMALNARPRALAAAEYAGVTRIMPSPAYSNGRRGQAIDRIVIHITGAPQSPHIGSWFAREEANTSAHYMIDQNGAIIQFIREQDTAWHAGVGSQNRRSIGIEHVAIQQGGARYPRRDGSIQTFPYTPPTDVEYSVSAALVAHLCHKYGLAPDRTTIIGHREADPNTSHSVCPDGAWDWDAYVALVAECYAIIAVPAAAAQGFRPAGQRFAATLSGGAETVEIKYRAFIPSPALKGPFFDNYHGDGRDFSHSGGTSRGEITFLVDIGAGGALSNLRITDRQWSPSHSYAAADTSAVAGKPDWWLDLRPGAASTGTASCPSNDETLRASIGAPGTMRNVLATAELASICSLYMSGNNPLLPGSPAIDADVSILLRRTASGAIEARAYGSHDGFPAHELYVNGQPIHRYDPVAAGNGPAALLPPEDQDVDTSWTTIPSQAAASGLGYGKTARALTSGRTLVFRDMPGQWRAVDFPRVSLTAVSWSDAADAPVAFAFFGHPNIDFDGSPTAYHPDDTGDDNLANAGDDQNGWYGVVALAPGDAAVTGGQAIIDQRPERERKGKYPVIQRAGNSDPNPGYYVSQTSRAADASLARHLQARYLDASRVAFGALSGKLKAQGVALGDYGLALRHDQARHSPFFLADSGGNTFALGEVSQKVGTDLGGSGRGNRFNNNFPVSFLIFPATATTSRTDPPPSQSDIEHQVTAIMSQLCLADNARELALLLGYAEAAPGDTPAGKAGLDRYLADPANTALPRNYATIVQALANFGFNVREVATAQSRAFHFAPPARILSGDDWSINWDEVQQIPQPTGMGCWATAAAMLTGWRDRMSVDPTLIARFTGCEPSLAGGLSPETKRAFADAVGLVVHPNACYTPEGFRDILEANGPVWVTAKVDAPVQFIHAVVVTGMYREGGRDYVRITDPLDRVVGTPGAPGARTHPPTFNTGSRYIMSWDDFTREFEAAGTIDRIQLLHTGGTHGHVINRGNAAGAGYAQALSDAKEAVAPTPPDSRFGVGTSITHARSEKSGARYDLAQLTGFVMPGNALAGGAGAPPLPGQRVVLGDWPYIDTASGRVSAGGVAIDFQHQAGAVGNVTIAPLDPNLLDGWTADVRADIAVGEITANRAQLVARVVTTFRQAGEEDQVGVTQVLLHGDGRAQPEHGAALSRTPAPAPAPAAPAPAPAPALAPVH